MVVCKDGSSGVLSQFGKPLDLMRQSSRSHTTSILNSSLTGTNVEELSAWLMDDMNCNNVENVERRRG